MGLHLTRRAGEKVLIGGGISVEVVECQRGFVRLLFEAPRDVPIEREERACVERADQEVEHG